MQPFLCIYFYFLYLCVSKVFIISILVQFLQKNLSGRPPSEGFPESRSIFKKFYKSLQPETGDIRGQKTSQRHEDIADGKGLQPSFHIKAHTIGIHPEIGVVHVAARSGTSSGSQEDQDGIQSQAAGNGSTQGGSGGHGNGAAALDDF